MLKPSDRTPGSASVLGSMLAATALPDASFSVLPTALSDAAQLSQDARISLVSFTGSAKVGWHIKRSVDKARVVR